MQFSIDNESGLMNLAATVPKDAQLLLRLPEMITLRREATYREDGTLQKLCYKTATGSAAVPVPRPEQPEDTKYREDIEEETEKEEE